MDLARLSRLQRYILDAAWENRATESRQADDPSQADLYYHEVLTGYFSFPVRWYAGRPLRSDPGSHHFDRAAIGPARYDAAQASLSHAVLCLEARGLVERYVTAVSWWSGLRLTDAAVRAAR
jgi:uncharacterized protein YfaT (DUF1175 family)